MKKIVAILLAVAMLLALAACGQTAAPETPEDPAEEATEAPATEAPATEAPEEDAETGEPTKMDEIREAGVLVLGTSADYPPYEFHTKIDGEDTIVGFDIAIAQYFADSLGVELEIVDMSFTSLLIGLANGDFDLVMAGLTPSEERKQAVDFTDTIFSNTQIVMIRQEDADKYTTTEDLAGKTVGAQTGRVQMDLAASVAGEENVVGLTRFQDLIMELKTGKLEAIFANSLVSTAYVSANPDLLVQDIGIDYEDPGFAGAVQKGNEEFVAYLNELIAEMQEQGLIQQYVAEAQILAGMTEE